MHKKFLRTLFVSVTLNIMNLVCAESLNDDLRVDDINANIQNNKVSNEDMKMIEAASFMTQGDFAKASETYQYLYNTTKDPYFLKQIALAQSQGGNFDTAVQYAMQYQELSKDNEDSETNLIIAENHVRNREYNLAIILLEKNLSINPTLQTHYILSNLYMREKMPEKALEHFIVVYNDEMSVGTKFRLEAFNQIVTIYLEQNQIDKALEYLNSFIASNEYEINIQNFVILYAKMNKLEILKDNLQKRFLESQNIENARMLVGILVELKQYGEAIGILLDNQSLLGTDGQEILMYVYAEISEFKNANNIAKYLYKETNQIQYLGLSAVYEFELLPVKDNATLQPTITTLKFVIDERNKQLKTQNKKLGQDEAFYYNFLGYLLIDYDIDINAGLEYVSTALAITPNSVEYLDSLAWGFYKSKNCKKAQETIRLIPVEKIQNLQEVQEHYNLIQQCS
ncbi:ATP-dependent nuclease [Helicobacter didelphidarum]|uniref:ATP-dependent nuclease n=1 Tax=Helicobacter didelphidarum TaxID=2040648 RepID=A0A3D8IPI5_9HELI|nr:ATP-dependent nuclease [Helicobacter didelphidarum]RDU67023.1 ATP-dependent nuclease [Helicobacter didelphidarum]